MDKSTTVRGVPAPLWQKFKVLCAQQGTSIQARIIELIRADVERNTIPMPRRMAD